jgi:hypothetical protein
MNVPAVAVGVLALTALAAVVWVQHQDSAELRNEIAGLRTDVQRGVPRSVSDATTPAGGSHESRLPTATDSLDQNELRKLREEIAALRASTKELTQIAQAAQAASALKSLGGTETTIATKLTPAEALKNAGKSTPEAATETILWAAFGGDVDTLSSGLVFTPTAREKADAWFAGLPEKTRTQYGTPEKVMALMIAKDAAGLSGVQVLGQKEIAPDNVGVRVRFGSTDGNTKDDNLLFRRVNDGWRMVLPDAAFEKIARKVSPQR